MPKFTYTKKSSSPYPNVEKLYDYLNQWYYRFQSNNRTYTGGPFDSPEEAFRQSIDKRLDVTEFEIVKKNLYKYRYNIRDTYPSRYQLLGYDSDEIVTNTTLDIQDSINRETVVHKRKNLSESEKYRILNRQNFCCANKDRKAANCSCDCWILRDGGFLKGLMEFDHIIALKDGGDNSLDNMQALCPTCHSHKTRSSCKKKKKKKNRCTKK